MYTAKEIIDLRHKVGVNKTEFAKKVGVDKSTITLWERGDRTPSPEYEKKLAKVDRLSSPSENQESRFLQALKGDLDDSSELEFTIDDDTDQQILTIFFSATSSYNQIKRALLASGGEIV